MRIIPFILIPLMILGFQQQEIPPGTANKVAGYSCEDCHIAESWNVIQPTGFSHDITIFPLKGQHRLAECRSCHIGDDFASIHSFGSVQSDCFSCHQDIHEDKLGNNCQECHNVNSWRVQQITFDHEETQFPLLGPHRSISCESCHEEGGKRNFVGLSLNCYRCHRENYDKTETPSHLQGEFPTNCEQCHSIRTEKWRPAFFSHAEEQTGFALLGMHITTACADCHIDNLYTGTPTSCGDDNPCHLADFSLTSNIPNHLTFGYPIEFCEYCHAPEGWIPDIYDHSPITTCKDCHTPNYEATKDPPHVESNGFSTTCETCHNSTSDWNDASFDHNAITSTCVTCHQSDYDNTTLPNHSTQGFNTDCAFCHKTVDWSDATFDHSFYQLSGNHATLSCTECHSNIDYEPSCWDCHRDDFFEEHSSGDDTNCWECHSTKDWEEDDEDDDDDGDGDGGRNIKEEKKRSKRHKLPQFLLKDFINSSIVLRTKSTR